MARRKTREPGDEAEGSAGPAQERGRVSRGAPFPEGRGPSKRGDPPIEERHGPRSRHGEVDRPREEP